LAASIEKHGLLQPVVVERSGKDGAYKLIAGHRRVAACRLLKKESVPAIELNGLAEEGEGRAIALAVVENVQRVDLKPLELALTFQKAISSGVFKDQESLARAIGKSKSFISKCMKVLKLPDEVLEKLSSSEAPRDLEALYLLTKVENTAKQVELFEKLMAGEIGRSEIKKECSQKGDNRANEKARVTIGKNSVVIKGVRAAIPKEKRKAFEAELLFLIEKYAERSSGDD